MMAIWAYGLIAATVLAACLLVVLTARWHHRWTGDFENSGVQKHHAGSPPRVGLLPVAAGLVCGGALLSQDNRAHHEALDVLIGLGWASLPVAVLGLLEDVTKAIRPLYRIAGACASGVIAWGVSGVTLPALGIPPLDPLMQLSWVAVPVTVLLVAGYPNAINIVDGLNGLAGGLALLMLVVTGITAAAVGDMVVANLCALAAATVFGFLLVNYPRGLIFLGDGAAYFIGFFLAQVWLMLLARNPQVSPWFVLAVSFYPVMETVFSIYRRRFRANQRSHAMAPDFLHLHSLLLRRGTRPWLEKFTMAPLWAANAAAGGLLVCAAGVFMAVPMLAPGSHALNAAVVVAGVAAYLLVFKRFIGFGWRVRAAQPRLEAVNAEVRG